MPSPRNDSMWTAIPEQWEWMITFRGILAILVRVNDNVVRRLGNSWLWKKKNNGTIHAVAQHALQDLSLNILSLTNTSIHPLNFTLKNRKWDWKFLRVECTQVIEWRSGRIQPVEKSYTEEKKKFEIDVQRCAAYVYAVKREEKEEWMGNFPAFLSNGKRFVLNGSKVDARRWNQGF